MAGVCLAEACCHHVRAPETVKIPLQSCSGLPCVDATFGKTQLKLLINLADQASYLTPVGVVKADAQRPPKEFGKARRFKLGPIELNDLFVVDETLGEALPNSPETLSPAVDGSLSYNAFSDRLLVLNIPGRVIELSAQPLTAPVCSANCTQLLDSRVGDMTGVVTLTTDGFAVGNIPLRARIDTAFQGSVVILDPIEGLKTQGAGPTEGSYRMNKLSYLETAPVYLGGKAVANAAAVVRADPAFGINGRQYNSAVGLSILSTGAYAFDLRSMKMWRYE
jgi:hypothetical protein